MTAALKIDDRGLAAGAVTWAVEGGNPGRMAGIGTP
jgi:hypothetical protein